MQNNDPFASLETKSRTITIVYPNGIWNYLKYKIKHRLIKIVGSIKIKYIEHIIIGENMQETIQKSTSADIHKYNF